jgi:exodeoxyribonuclease-3
MRILSLNVNGIRSACRKGLWEWLSKNPWDILCVQEVRADTEMALCPIENTYSYVFSAQRAGYSGTAIYTRSPALVVQQGIDQAEFDAEGRILIAEWPNLRVVSAYFPSGSSSPERQEAKFRFLEAIQPHLECWREGGVPTVLCGDFNVAHQPIDLKNWKGNQKNSGFLPEEREWVSSQLAMGWEDTFRRLYPDVAGYTWWSNRGQAYAKDVGWRIDYQWANKAAHQCAQQAVVIKDPRLSDHAILAVDYLFAANL